MMPARWQAFTQTRAQTRAEERLHPGRRRGRAKTGRCAFFCYVCVACVVLASRVAAGMPATSFAGAYGATAGGGALTGWTRLGGDNPAILASPGYSVALSGYVPFGLAGVRVTELAAARDAPRWGVALAWRYIADHGDGSPRIGGADNGSGVQGTESRAEGASRVRAQAAWRATSTLSVGAQADLHRSGTGGFGGGVRETSGWSAGGGGLWTPHPALVVAATGELVPRDGVRVARLGVGVDAGWRGTHPGGGEGRGAEARFSVEYIHERSIPDRPPDGTAPAALRLSDAWRYAVMLRPHPLFGVHAGYAPAQETMALGVVFGVGGWQGYSAVRRHRVLGSTAVQGLSWRSSSRTGGRVATDGGGRHDARPARRGS